MRPVSSIVIPCPKAWFRTWSSECDLKRKSCSAMTATQATPHPPAPASPQAVAVILLRVPGTVVKHANPSTVENEGALGWEDHRFRASLGYTVVK